MKIASGHTELFLLSFFGLLMRKENFKEDFCNQEFEGANPPKSFGKSWLLENVINTNLN